MEHRLEDVVQGEENLFQTAIVPIRLDVGGSCVWRNEKPNSFQFCRPLHLQYQKESNDLCKREYADLVEQREKLMDYTFVMNEEKNEHLNIKFKIDLTMFDGKVLNVLTDTASTQSCNICGAKPSEMNKLEVIQGKPVNEKACELALSTLHCWIRVFKYILHLGYKMDIKKYQA